MPPRSKQQPQGINLGVLGLMLIGFFVLVFVVGRPAIDQIVVKPITDPTHAQIPNLLGNSSATEALQKAFHLGDSDPLQQKINSQAREIEDLHVKLETLETQSESELAQLQAKLEKLQKENSQLKDVIVKQAVDGVTPEAKTGATTPQVTPVQKEEPKAPSTTTDKSDGGLTEIDKEYTPTREMVQRIAQDGYLVVTWANWHYFDFVRTWVKHVQQSGITGYIVGAMDDHLLTEMIKLKYNCFSMKSGLTLGDFGWGSKTFAKMGREKIRLISIFLKLDVQVVIADVDVLWLRNPLPYFQRYPDADVLSSSDNLINTVKDESLEKWPEAAGAANIGIMLFRKNSLEFVERWIEIIEKDETVWDQNAFNDLFRIGLRTIPNDPNHYFLGYNGKLKMGILPVSIFASGHTMYVQRMAEKLGLQPYAVHNTFQFSGTPGKRNRMREFKWFDDYQEYYDHKVGFMSFDMDGIEALLKDAGPNTGRMDLANVQGHFKLVNHQLLRIRHAMGIATTLGRAVVMPELWCGQDRWWAPHAGTIPGSKFDLPFKCPMDHVFDLEYGWFAKKDANVFGPMIEFREYSFLNNSHVSPVVRDSRVVIEICGPTDPSCSDGSSPASIQNGPLGKTLRMRAGLQSEQIKTALRNAETYKVLHFTSMNGVFKEFTNPADNTKFYERLKTYGSIWCCVNAHPGHIHYDMLWDMPHTDKHGKKWTTWQPTTGP